MTDSFTLSQLTNNNRNRFYDYGSPANSREFLSSPSSSISILLKNHYNSSSNNTSLLQALFCSDTIDKEISTLFVVGFPDDMQEREFQNMFIFSPGFETATLKIPTSGTTSPTGSYEDVQCKQIIGFVKFRSRLEAMNAREILTGRKIDQEKGSTLKAEMAKKNLHTKKMSHDSFYSFTNDNIIPTSTQSASKISLKINNNRKGSLVCPSTVPKSKHPFLPDSIYSHNNISSDRFITNSKLVALSTMSTPLLSTAVNYDQNLPCNTLYVGNLPLNADEKELRSIFYDCPGYKRLVFKNNFHNNNGPMCFVEFSDISLANLAMKELQGKPLTNSNKCGIRLSFSKNPLGICQYNLVSSASSSLH